MAYERESYEDGKVNKLSRIINSRDNQEDNQMDKKEDSTKGKTP
jgi:hypothetical protein